MTSYVTEDMRRAMADKVLSVVAEYEGVVIYRLGPSDGSWMESTRIMISREPLAEQIIITGDLCPGANGILSNFGYGVRWFGRKQSEEYLCSKFLRREWVPERAKDTLYEALRETMDTDVESEGADEDANRRLDLIEDAIIASDDPRGECAPTRTSEAFYEFWTNTFGDAPENEGMDYNPRDAGWLCAIQQRFAKCYRSLQSAKSSLS
jgi:hypothetical protein